NPGAISILRAVSAVSANDIWAVGLYQYSMDDQTMTIHWDGSQWNNVPSPSQPDDNDLYGLTTISPNDAWVVGYYGHPYYGTPDRTLTMHFTAPPCGSPTRTPTGTPNPLVSRTATRTPTLTPTLCPMSFSDVPVGEWYYEYVRCLYCRGGISGYADGTFRPYNNTTRAQMAKSVVLAFTHTIYTTPVPT